MANSRVKRIVTELNKLKNMGRPNALIKDFIVDSNPFEDEENPPSSKENSNITGRLFLNSPIYKDGSIKIKITIGPTFPIEPPKVSLITVVFHPNVSNKGEVSINLLNKNGGWTATTTLEKIITEVAEVIDKPSIDRIQYPEAASLYDTNREEYTRIATETFNKNASLPN